MPHRACLHAIPSAIPCAIMLWHYTCSTTNVLFTNWIVSTPCDLLYLICIVRLVEVPGIVSIIFSEIAYYLTTTIIQWRYGNVVKCSAIITYSVFTMDGFCNFSLWVPLTVQNHNLQYILRLVIYAWFFVFFKPRHSNPPPPSAGRESDPSHIPGTHNNMIPGMAPVYSCTRPIPGMQSLEHPTGFYYQTHPWDVSPDTSHGASSVPGAHRGVQGHVRCEFGTSPRCRPLSISASYVCYIWGQALHWL